MSKPFTIEQTWLSCIGCGYRTDLLDERKFRCPQCGDLYDVDHNFDNFEDLEGLKISPGIVLTISMTGLVYRLSILLEAQRFIQEYGGSKNG